MILILLISQSSEGFGSYHASQQRSDVVVEQLIDLHLQVTLRVPLTRVLYLDLLLSSLTLILCMIHDSNKYQSIWSNL